MSGGRGRLHGARRNGHDRSGRPCLPRGFVRHAHRLVHRLCLERRGPHGLPTGRHHHAAHGRGCPVAGRRQLLAIAGQGDYCGGCIYHVDPVSGQYQTHNAQNNNNTLSLDPTRTVLYAGWDDTNISTLSVAGGTMSDGTPHAVTGGDGVATSIAFTSTDGAFYVTGGTGFGNFGRIDLSTFVTTRLLSNVPGAVVAYDPFSDSLILSGGGVCYQVRAGDPTNVISMRNDSATDNYIELQPDGNGHLFGTVCCGNGGIVILDYSASGLIGDPSTVIGHALLPGVSGLSGGLAVTTHNPCGTADFNCDGDVGTDTDIADFFACLSGSCPAPPCVNTADFNGDGDVGTDADIEAFFRVLGGGTC